MPRQRTKATPSAHSPTGRGTSPKSDMESSNANPSPTVGFGGGRVGANTKASLSSLIKSSRDIMRKDAGLNGDLDRLPQLSWILFLKCYDDLEMRREEDSKLSRQAYKPVIQSPYRWRDWASDEDNWATGEDLIKFINDGLLPGLRGLTGSD